MAQAFEHGARHIEIGVDPLRMAELDDKPPARPLVTDRRDAGRVDWPHGPSVIERTLSARDPGQRATLTAVLGALTTSFL